MHCALMVALASGCGAPMMLDIDGHPIERPALIASGEGVWLVVDSSRTAVRAVVEVQLDAPEHQAPMFFPPLQLSIGAAKGVTPLRARLEPAFCPVAQRGRDDAKPLTVDVGRCYQVLRAEFALDRRPTASESVHLVWGAGTKRLRWELLSSATAAALAQRAYRSPPPLGLDEYFPVPEDNPLTPEKVALGRRLFFEPRLARDSSVACASCHRPDRTFADSERFSLGVRGQRTSRNAPAILNRAYGGAFFWDGRAATLEETVLQPIQNPREMDLDLGALVLRLRADSVYRGAFDRVFQYGVTEQNVARALAAYVRTLRSGNAPVDRYLNGEAAALSADARAGLALFVGKANCSACHVGPTFTDEKLHNTGVGWGLRDPGRYAVTGRDADRGKFKTPSLRNVELTAPYMHDGSLLTLDAVVAFYDSGGNRNPGLDPELRPLHLMDREKRNLVAFLTALTGDMLGEPGKRY